MYQMSEFFQINFALSPSKARSIYAFQPLVVIGTIVQDRIQTIFYYESNTIDRVNLNALLH